MATKINLRRDTSANWTSANPILSQGEPGYETNTGKLKIGDGITVWNSLAYYATSSLTVDELAAITGANAPDAINVFATLADVGGAESDPVFTASDVFAVTTADITDWNTAFGWGNHASAGYLTTISGLNISLLTNDSAFITASALSPYLTTASAALTYEPIFTTLPISKGGTNSNAALSNNRIIQSSGGAIVEAAAITALKALKSDANGIPVHFDTATEPSLTELSYVKGVTSDIQTQIGTKEDKSLPAYTFHANNTNATADATHLTFKSIAEQTYSGSITWTGTTAPSGTTDFRYSWTQVGDLVTYDIALVYGTAGTAVTSLVFDLPSDMPTPKVKTGLGGASGMLYRVIGSITTSITITTSGTVGYLRRNSGNTANEFYLGTSSGNHKIVLAQGHYHTA